ncbi:hypothetical protein ACFHW3_15215, partial [Actinomadura sp. LOL_011]
SQGGPSQGGPSQGGPSQGGPSQGGPPSGGPSAGGPPQGGQSSAGPAQSGPPQGTPVSSGLAKTPPPANGTSGHRRGDKPADRRPPAGRGRHGTRGASQHFGSDRLAGRDAPDPQDKSVAGGPEEDSPANRTRDDFHI